MSTGTWFYRQNGENIGPVGISAIKARLVGGQLLEDTLVWTEGMDDWVPLSQVPELHEQDGDHAVCAVTGERRPKDELLPFGDHWVLPEHREALVQQIEESGNETVVSADLVGKDVPEFRPVGRVARVASAFLKAQIGCYATLLLFTLLMLWEVSLGDLGSMAFGVAGIGLLISYLGTIISFLIWTVRSAKNARAAAPRIMEMSPGWCAGFYFIPIAHLWKPYEGMRQICDAHFRTDPEKRDSLPLIAWWWCWIIGSILDRIYSRLNPNGDTFTTTEHVVLCATAAFMISSAVQLLSIIKQVTARQAETDPSAL